MAEKEEDWEYYDEEDGEDYEWEYEEEEEESPAPTKAAPEPAKPAPKVEEPKPKQIEEAPRRRERPKIEIDENPQPRRRERPKIESPEPPRRERLGKDDRNDILEQMKRLQEGYKLEVDEDDDDVKPKPKPSKMNLDDIDLDDLEDMDLLDPFGDDPVPKKKDVPTNGHKNGDDKKHRKHKKKSRTGNDDDHDKKIHVRSKDPRKIARQFEKVASEKPQKKHHNNHAPSSSEPRKVVKKPPPIEVNKICKICGKEPYLVERLVAEKSWWCKKCFRCHVCNKILNLDTYASHQGVIYCKAHHRELFMPKAVEKDSMEEIVRKKKNVDFSVYENGNSVEALERHERQQKRMETIVRESRPVELEGVVKSQSDNTKWDGLENLDVGSKFLMFEKQEEKEKQSSDRYGIMEKLKRLQAGEDVGDLLEELNDEVGYDEEVEEEDEEDYGLTEVQKKAVHAEKLFSEKTKKEKMAETRAKELKALRERLMAGTRESVLDSFDELNHRKIKKTEVDVRGANAKKFMEMFDKGEVPEGMSASDRITLEKDAELHMMRTKKRGERDFFKKLENGDVKEDAPKEPKLLVGKLKVNEDEHGDEDPDTATLSKKFSFFEKGGDGKKKPESDPVTSERAHAVKECKASSVLNKFKQMEERAANGEDEYARSRPVPRKFTPPRKLHSDSESGSEYSDSEYSDSEYTESDYSSDEDYDGTNEEKEYLRAVKDAARAKALRAKFEEWEASVGEDGGYINLVDENGLPLETASKLKNRFEKLGVEPEAPKTLPNPRKFQVKRFKPKEAYEHQVE